MKGSLVRVACALVLLGSAACSTTIVDPVPPGSDALTQLPRALSPGEQKLVGATNDFSFSLFRQLSKAQAGQNIFTSPLSASIALGMTMNGAANATYNQMRTTLAYGTASDAEINASYQTLMALLKGLDPLTDVRIANSIWYEKTFPFNQSFLDAGKTWFNAQVSPLDFSNPASAATINNWVSTATGGTIPTIVDQIRDEVMILVNAVYFKGTWRPKFDVAQTTDATFRGVAGDQPMRLMHRSGSVNAAFRQDLVAADLPYGDSTWTMTVVIPQGTSTVDDVASSLQSSSWSTLLGQMRPITTDLYIPKLKLQWERTLNDDLIALGMTDAFSETRADFSRMTPQGVKISYVKQKVYVEVNEEGTTAAAATSVGIVPTSLPPQIRADRPFIIVIRERLTGTILFMGKIAKMP